MFQNPLVQAFLLFFGSYMLMNVLKKHPPAGTILTIAAGIFTIVIWMLRFQRTQLAGVYRNPMAKPVIDLVCSMIKEQPPIDGSMPSAGAQRTQAQPALTQGSNPQRRAPVSAREFHQPGHSGADSNQAGTGPSPLLITSTGDPHPVADLLKQVILNNDETIDKLISQIQQNLRLRERSAPTANLPPLGMFLCWGNAGLGKRSLASEVGRHIYPGDSVGTLDFAERGASVESLTASAISRPQQTFIIENLESASQQEQDDLLSIFKGAPAFDRSTSRPVSFRHCVFFVLVHKQAVALPKVITANGAAGFTQVVDRLASTLQIDEMLGLLMHGIFTFELPNDDVALARVIALLMQRECRKYDLDLASVDPAALSREVEEVAKLGGFKASQARVARVMSRPIALALQRQETSVRVPATAQQRAWIETT